jgi:hypothetical protein
MATGVPIGRGCKLRGQHVGPFFHCSIWLCYTASDLALAHEKQNLNPCTIKNVYFNNLDSCTSLGGINIRMLGFVIQVRIYTF